MGTEKDSDLRNSKKIPSSESLLKARMENNSASYTKYVYVYVLSSLVRLLWNYHVYMCHVAQGVGGWGPKGSETI